jgi:hypothetical protein
MNASHDHAGRWVGAAMLYTFAAGIYSNFGLQAQLFDGGGYLINAAKQPGIVGKILVLGLIGCLVAAVVASIISQHFAAAQPRLTRIYYTFAVVGVAATVMELTTLSAMQSLSEQFTTASAAAGAQYDAAKAVIGGLRNGIHFPDKLVGGASVLLMFAIFQRSRTLPKALTLFGMFAALCQMGAIGAAFFGHEVNPVLLAPLALAYLTTCLWLLVRGFPSN